MSEENLDTLLERQQRKFSKEVKFYAAVVIAILILTMIQQLLE